MGYEKDLGKITTISNDDFIRFVTKEGVSKSSTVDLVKAFFGGGASGTFIPDYYYYQDSAAPVLNDHRMKSNGGFLDFERYNGTAWVIEQRLGTPDFSVKNDDFMVEDGKSYLVDSSNGTMTVGADDTVASFTLYCKDTTWSSTNKVYVVLGVDTVELSGDNTSTYYKFVKDGLYFWIYNGEGKIKARALGTEADGHIGHQGVILINEYTYLDESIVATKDELNTQDATLRTHINDAVATLKTYIDEEVAVLKSRIDTDETLLKTIAGRTKLQRVSNDVWEPVVEGVQYYAPNQHGGVYGTLYRSYYSWGDFQGAGDTKTISYGRTINRVYFHHMMNIGDTGETFHPLPYTDHGSDTWNMQLFFGKGSFEVKMGAGADCGGGKGWVDYTM